MISTKAVVAGLVAVNVVLGAALAVRFGFNQNAYGQIGGGAPLHAVGGVVKAGSTLFVFDPATGQVGVVQVDAQKNKFVFLDRVNVVKDMQNMK